jgi:hypothetical protein
MITIRHINGSVCYEDGDYKVIISNLHQFSMLRQKIWQASSVSDDEFLFKHGKLVIDMLDRARTEFITNREKQCISDLS